MPQNVLTVKVNDKSKILRFSETLVAGSVYSITVEGGADICGSQAVLGLKIGNTTVGWAELADGAGELSLLTQELADVLVDVREGSRIPALAVIRCMDESANQVIGVGKADILYAGKGWMETTALVQITAKGEKGDVGDSAYQIAVKHGFEGSEEDWFNEMMGAAHAAQEACELAKQAKSEAENATKAIKSIKEYDDEDAQNVFSRLWGNIKSAVQSISAKWTFAISPNVPVPTEDNGAANKKYVDDLEKKCVLIEDEQVIKGKKTFVASPSVPTAEDINDRSDNAASTKFVQAVVATVQPRYPLVTKSLVGGSVVLDDRSINILAIGSVTTATLNIPTGKAGMARDFWLIVTASTAVDREISIVGGTCYGEHSSTFELNEGVVYPNVFVFTEIQTDVFIVRRRAFTVQSNIIV